MAEKANRWRVYRHPTQPKKSDLMFVGHVGDVEKQSEVKGLAKKYKGITPSGEPEQKLWVEPVVFNGDPENPVYKNAGKIEEVKV